MELYNVPLVSIVIPVYNVEKYLPESIGSAIDQTYTNIEIILVNDGSPDKCPKICDKFAAEFEHISVVHKKNGGLSDARNFGLNKAMGEFILFLDSDDILVDDAVEQLIKKALEKDADMVIPDRYTLVREEDKEKKQVVFHFDASSSIETPLEFALEVMIGAGRAWRAHSLLYRASLIKENDIKFPVGYIAEDIIFNLAVLAKAKNIAFYENSTVNYLKRAGSITTSFQGNLDEVFLFIDKEVEKFLKEVNSNDEEGELKRKKLLCRNMINFTLKIFSNNCQWSKKEKYERANNIFDYGRLQETLSLEYITVHSSKLLSQENLKEYLYKIIFKLIKKDRRKTAFFIARIVGKVESLKPSS